MIRITCDACGKQFHIADRQAAGPAVCPACGVKTVALEPIDAEAALEPAKAGSGAGATMAPNPFATPSPGPDLSGYGPQPSPPADAAVSTPPGTFAFDLSEPESDDDHRRQRHDDRIDHRPIVGPLAVCLLVIPESESRGRGCGIVRSFHA